MNESLITVRYVKALFHLAEELKQQEKVKADMEFLLNCIQKSKEFQFLIETPLVKIRKKIQFFDELFSKHLNNLTIKFLHLLVNNRRETLLKGICYYYIHFYQKTLGIKKTIITTASPLLPKHREEINNFITRKLKIKLDLHEKVNAEIIGGYILQIEDQQINASLHHQLTQIKRELTHS